MLPTNSQPAAVTVMEDPLLTGIMREQLDSMTNNKVERQKEPVQSDKSRESSHESTAISVKEMAGKVYANNAPKILLETITARSASLIIIITYIVFLIGFTLDFMTSFETFGLILNTCSSVLPGESCDLQTQSSLNVNQNFACTNGSTWTATVRNLQNIISFQLDVQRTNVSYSSIYESTTQSEIFLDINMWACYESDGSCTFNGGSINTKWQTVIVNFETKITYYASRGVGSQVVLGLLPNTFQNQDSLPTMGLVKSYYIQIKYLDDPLYLFSSPTGGYDPNLAYVTYPFNVACRSTEVIKDSLTVCLMFITIVVLGIYIQIVNNHVKETNGKWLSEQKWIVYYFIAVILFQNPVQLVVLFSNVNDSVGAFVAYLIDGISQGLLFTIWFLFADSIHHKLKPKYLFYGPKILFGILYLSSTIITTCLEFPFDQTNRSPTAAISSWPENLLYFFSVFRFLMFFMLWIWLLVWLYNIVASHRTLDKLPYMSTRYMQLSHRFFIVQSSAVTLYYLLQYWLVFYLIYGRESANANSSSDINFIAITDDITTLFHEQTTQFGKILLLTTYAVILAFLFLPANFLGHVGISNTFMATYVITEEELETEVKARKLTISNLRKNVLTNNVLMHQLVKMKAEVFCISIALKLRDLSFQAYYDPPALKTLSSYDGVMNLAFSGFEFVDAFYDTEHETFCFIARELSTQKLTVVFRGTASRRQMEDNLNYKRMELNIIAMKLCALDEIDGLDVPEFFAAKDENELFEILHGDDNVEELDAKDFGNMEEGGRRSSISKRDSDEGRRLSVRRSFSLNDANDRDKDKDRDSTTIDSNSLPNGSARQNMKKSSSLRDSFSDGANNVERGVQRVGKEIVHATNLVVDGMITSASNTPVLRTIVKPHVHSGFWSAYEVVRPFIHTILRRELSKNPSAQVYFCGHSLGGALATFAAMDVTIHTLPRINAYLKYKAMETLSQYPQSPRHTKKQSTTSVNVPQSFQQKLNPLNLFSRSGKSTNSDGTGGGGLIYNKIRATMYSYGSPRIGNRSFAQFYDRVVPDSFRVCVDGDLVTGLPKTGFKHIGTYVLVDGQGAGSIIIDPSFVERWLRTRTAASVAAHSLLVYRKGLLGVKHASEYIRSLAQDSPEKLADILELHAISNSQSGDKLAKDGVQSLTEEQYSRSLISLTTSATASQWQYERESSPSPIMNPMAPNASDAVTTMQIRPPGAPYQPPVATIKPIPKVYNNTSSSKDSTTSASSNPRSLMKSSTVIIQSSAESTKAIKVRRFSADVLNQQFIYDFQHALDNFEVEGESDVNIDEVKHHVRDVMQAENLISRQENNNQNFRLSGINEFSKQVVNTLGAWTHIMRPSEVPENNNSSNPKGDVQGLNFNKFTIN